MKYEELLNQVGSYGPYQKRLVYFMMFAVFPNVFANLMLVYLHYTPDFVCISNASMNVSQNGIWQAIRCKKSPVHNASTSNDTALPHTTSCNNEYVYERKLGESSVVMEFNLVCENAWKVPFSVSVYMAGKAIAAIFGKLSDKFGRRPIFLSATVIQYLCFGAAGFSWNYESYVTCLFFVGLSAFVNYISSFVLTTEMVTREHRNKTIILNYLACATAYVITPVVAYFVRDWRWLLRVVSLSGILYIPYYWLIPESARWLIMMGKKEEAKQLLSKIAKANGKMVNVEELFEENIDLTAEERTIAKSYDIAKESSLLFVLRQSELLPRFLAIFSGWFICSMVYYGISLNPTQLSGDRFLNVVLMGLVEFPAYSLCYTVEWIGRPRAVFLFMTVTGVFCAIAPFLAAVRSEVVTAVVVISKACVTSAYGIVYLILLEISPTLVRNYSMSVGSFYGKLGGFISPYIMYAGQTENRFIPYVIMAGMTITVGFLSLLFLPETRAIPMPDTVQEASSNKRYYKMKLCRKFEKKEIAELPRL